jgi:phytoene dehydrogenase-like protein
LNDVWLQELRETTKPAVCSYISIGVRAELPLVIPEWQLDEPIKYADKEITEIGFNNYAMYEGYAPKGCTALTTAFMGDTYDFWKRAKDEGRYDEEKYLLAEQISRAFCRKYPQAEGEIEVIDIATPLTYERYTGAYHGSWMTIQGPDDKMKTYPGSVESVKGLYFSGHRIMPPGGHPSALMTGRMAAQMVCRQFDVMFL